MTRSAKYADKWFKLLEARVHPLIMAEEGQPRIKVAILDTGIQLPEEAEEVYEEQILCCKSWLKAEKGSDLLKGDRDLDGHGTHCASLLLKVAPNVDIYVARVFQKRSERKGTVGSTETQQAIADVCRTVSSYDFLLTTRRPSGMPRRSGKSTLLPCLSAASREWMLSMMP